jgi:glycosyltransferase involved in cell wall biosynthesis
MENHNSKTNVLLLNDHLGWDGKVMHGVAKLFLQWIPAFNKDKYNVTLCLLRKKDPLHEYFQMRGIKVRFLGKGKYDPSTILSLARVIREENIDLMHVQQYGSMTFGRLVRLIKGIPILVHYHDMASYYPFVQRMSDLVLARFTDAGLAVSNAVKKFQIENGRAQGLDPKRITVMYNCVSLDEFKTPPPEQISTEKKLMGIDPEYRVVGTVTRLYEIKGNRFFIEAAAEVVKVLPKTIFLIVGDGPLRYELEKLSQGLNIQDNVIFTGFCDDVPRLMATFDVKVFSSWSDGGSPLPVIEAMAMGKPIISTDVVEIIEDGVTGLIVPTKDSKEMAKNIISLLNNDDLSKRLGTNAKKESKKYDVHTYVRKLEEIYDNLVSGSREKS